MQSLDKFIAENSRRLTHLEKRKREDSVFGNYEIKNGFICKNTEDFVFRPETQDSVYFVAGTSLGLLAAEVSSTRALEIVLPGEHLLNKTGKPLLFVPKDLKIETNGHDLKMIVDISINRGRIYIEIINVIRDGKVPKTSIENAVFIMETGIESVSREIHVSARETWGAGALLRMFHYAERMGVLIRFDGSSRTMTVF